MIETTWLETDNSVIIDYIKKYKVDTINKKQISICLSDNITFNCSIFTNDYNSTDSLELMFDTEPVLSRHQINGSIYIVCTNNIDTSNFYKKLNISTRYLGFYTKTLDKCLILCDNSFGLIKSTIIGYYSAIMQYHGKTPLHCGALEFKEKTAVFIGGSGVGKTTLILNMVNIYYDKGLQILSDDWCFVDEQTHKVTPVENFFSFKENHIHENPHIPLEKIKEHSVIKGKKKYYIHRDAIYKYKSIKNTLEIICFLTPLPSSDSLFLDIDYNEVLDKIIDSVYHMPTILKEKRREFWSVQLQKKKVLAINSRCYNTKSQDSISQYGKIFEHIFLS